METRNITVTLEKAREWYNSGDATLKEVALQAFNKDELVYNFKNIKTFKDACEALNYDFIAVNIAFRNVSIISRASAAMFKLNIIRKALNLGQDLHLVEDPKDSYTYYPDNPFIIKEPNFYKKEIDSGKMKIIGEIKSEGEEYYVLSGCVDHSWYKGLGTFVSDIGVGGFGTSNGFLGCASKEIAEHFGKYFGMLITEAKYGDMIDFEIISDHY